MRIKNVVSRVWSISYRKGFDAELSWKMLRHRASNSLSTGKEMLAGTAACKAESSGPFFMEKQEGFECSTPTDSEIEADSVSFTALCTDTDYSIRSDGALDITAKIELNADLCSNLQTDIIQSVTVLEDKPKNNRSDYALRICYADGEDDCWTIAKRYGTSVDAVMNENDIEDRDALLSGMILIPSLR